MSANGAGYESQGQARSASPLVTTKSTQSRLERPIYYDVGDRIRWLKSNNWKALIVGAGFVVATIVLRVVRRSCVN